MKQKLDKIFTELGMAQYLAEFLEQGFDTWETILDITESDLDALGVKLGHRRKLQRYIANERGIAPGAALVSSAKASLELTRLEHSHLDSGISGDGMGHLGPTKRKYRRHPKPDENAPERPPSAYVLFSNKTREDLKGQNLSFTEIAKLVGENWQGLSPAERAPFETQAQLAKDRYTSELAAYKKTPNFEKYTAYLLEFKQKQALREQGKDGSKRVKLAPARTHSGGGQPRLAPTKRNRSSSGSSDTSRDSHGSMSGDESARGSEPPASMANTAESSESYAKSKFATQTPTSESHSTDPTMVSPSSSHFDVAQSVSPPVSNTTPHGNWTERSTKPEPDHHHSHHPHHLHHHQLPPLSDVFRSISPPPDGKSYRSPTPGLSTNPSRAPSFAGCRTPTLPHDGLPAGNPPGLLNAATNRPLPPKETSSLPIHALLATSGDEPPYQPHPSPVLNGVPRQPEARSSYSTQHLRTSSTGNGFHSPPSLCSFSSTDSQTDDDNHPAATSPPRYAFSPTLSGRRTPSNPKFDGMNALLRAGEIVRQRTR